MANTTAASNRVKSLFTRLQNQILTNETLVFHPAVGNHHRFFVNPSRIQRQWPRFRKPVRKCPYTAQLSPKFHCMQRRSFLKTTGLLTTGAVLAKPADLYAHAAPLEKNERVIILGAGISGLAAAHYLHRKGVPFTVLEARNRVGGRIFTHTIDEPSGLHVELGAEWVGASHGRMISLCKELGLNLLDHTFQGSVLQKEKYHPASTLIRNKDWEHKYQTLLERFRHMDEKEKKSLDKIDWWRYLVKQGIPQPELEWHELNDSTDFGESIRNVSAYAGIAEYAESSPNNEMDYKIEGGNSQITNKLTNVIGVNTIQINKKVIQVNQTGRQVEVVCEDGTKTTGHRVVCTLPAVAVSGIQWNPALPEAKTEALQQLQYARIIKSSVLFRERFWKDESLSIISDTLPHYFFHTTKNQSGTKGVLTSYAVGDKAYIFSMLSNEQKIKQICQALKPAFGEVEAYAEKTASHYWGDDAYTQGAYANYDVGQWYGLREAIAKPFRNILFTGEHVADWQGFMEGAAQTGQDAAKALAG